MGLTHGLKVHRLDLTICCIQDQIHKFQAKKINFIFHKNYSFFKNFPCLDFNPIEKTFVGGAKIQIGENWKFPN